MCGVFKGKIGGKKKIKIQVKWEGLSIFKNKKLLLNVIPFFPRDQQQLIHKSNYEQIFFTKFKYKEI
jgi:hypothetical protein